MKINCALIGPGNIGTDLLYKLLRSDVINPVWMVGIDPNSDGLIRARDKGLKTTHEGVDGLLPWVESDGIKIAFDATSAYVHPETSRKLTELGVKVIDLTPAAIGPFCVPPVNLEEHSSKSAGPGTRKNIDEFTVTTSRAIEKIGGVKKGKAIIILNPAEPPLMMRDTVHCLTESEPDQDAIRKSVLEMEKAVQSYVPGYRIKEGPVFDRNRVSIYLEVKGKGDYLPDYAGNLDIMTAAAAKTAEMFAKQMLTQD